MVKLTKDMRKKIRRLAKLVAKEKNMAYSGYEIEQVDKVVGFDKEKDEPITIKRGIAKIAMSQRGLYKHLIEQIETGHMPYSTALYLLEVNEMKHKGQIE